MEATVGCLAAAGLPVTGTPSTYSDLVALVGTDHQPEAYRCLTSSLVRLAPDEGFSEARLS